MFGNLLQRIKASEEISFLFSLVDSATGREFQDQAAHNLASLGKSNGERPFRLLAQPFHFAPRSTLRVQITERTEGVRGTLFIVLYGYKILGTSCVSRARDAAAARDRRTVRWKRSATRARESFRSIKSHGSSSPVAAATSSKWNCRSMPRGLRRRRTSATASPPASAM